MIHSSLRFRIAAEIKNNLIAFWKRLCKPSDREDQWRQNLRQKLQEIAKADFETTFLEIRSRLDPEFGNTKERIEAIQEELNGLQQRLSIIESSLFASQSQRELQLPESHSEEL